MVRRVLVGVLLLSLLSTAAAAQDAQLEDELDRTERAQQAARDKLERLESRTEKARGALSETQQRLEQAEAELERVEAAFREAEQEYEQARRRAREAADRLERVNERLKQTQHELAVKQQVLTDRVASAYKYGNVSMTQVLLEAEDIGDFLNSAKYVGRVMDNDRNIVVEIEELVAEVARQRQEADAAHDEAVQLEQEAEQARKTLEQRAAEQRELAATVAARRDRRKQKVADLDASRAEVEEHLDSLAKESSRIEAELAELARKQREEAERRAAAQAAAQASSGSAHAAPRASGGWTWPHSCGRVTSRYGMRWGRMHEGVDIACGSGSPIYAARDGVVAPVSCGGGYGNCVIVAHDGGFSTLYGHQSRVAVSSGQSVQAGQVVGYEGSTGHSTGPHLHLEVRVNGSPRDPCPYIGC